MSETKAGRETIGEYKQRILRYVDGPDPVVLQAKAPDVLATLVEGLSTEQLDYRPASGKWSIREIVAHLADDELVGGYRIRLILSAPGTTIQAFNQDVWARTGRYNASDIVDSLALYRTLRLANLKLLGALTPDEWEMFGVHAERGVESVRDIVMYFAGHDINHFRQIESIRRAVSNPTSTVSLRDVQESDLPAFYEHQRDPEATEMAAFPSRDWDAFTAHWAKIMSGNTGIAQTVVFDGTVAGNICCWQDSGEKLVGYWIGREYWGKGIATAALSEFLKRLPDRPLSAHVAKHNVASIRVLEKCGFVIVGDERFSDAEGTHILESVLRLDSVPPRTGNHE
jgi:RimJ/RimL family protein N-acetyltransferase